MTFDAAGLSTGTHTTTLRLEGSHAAQPVVSLTVRLQVLGVCEPVTVTAFGWFPLTPTVGQQVRFTAEATGTEPIVFSWAFGDGGQDSGAVVTHTYGQSNTYTVTLTASNPCDQTVLRDILAVTGPTHWVYLPLVRRTVAP